MYCLIILYLIENQFYVRFSAVNDGSGLPAQAGNAQIIIKNIKKMV
jgi:hypothetical protein